MTLGFLEVGQDSKNLSVDDAPSQEGKVTYEVGSKVVGITLFGNDNQPTPLRDGTRIEIQHGLLSQVGKIQQR